MRQLLTEVEQPRRKNKHKDFVKFKIRDLAANGKWLIFPTHLGSITDTITPEYTQDRYIGRPDVHIYSGQLIVV